MFIPTILLKLQNNYHVLVSDSVKRHAAVKSINAQRHAFIALSLAILLLGSCQKKQFSEPAVNSTNAAAEQSAATGNTAPKANAGLNKVVVKPASSTKLSGSGSDAEGPVTFLWKQVAGPNTATIAQPTQAVTGISNLVLGVYKFVLKATDNSGVSKTDTTIVSVMEKLTWTVNGRAREAIVHRPSGGTGAPPVLFIFHGYGGSDTNFAVKKAFESYWEEAIVVYPQGLLSVDLSSTTCQKNGWQRSVGEVNCNDGDTDQDLKFFDAMLPTLKNKYNANLSLVFVHGHSAGGMFVYNALWPGRGSKIAALAPSGSILDSAIGTTGKLPKPLMHSAGTNDDVMPFVKQEQGVEKVRVLNQCSTAGTPWATGPGGLLATRYASPIKDPVVFLQYTGPHSYPPTVPPLIVKFFKEVMADILTKKP